MLLLMFAEAARYFPLSGLNDVYSGKQTRTFQQAALAAVPREVCVSLISEQYGIELNLVSNQIGLHHLSVSLFLLML